MFRALGSASCDITHETGLRFVTGIGFCVLRYHTRDKGYDLKWELGSAADLRLVISHTRQAVRFATGHETGGTICQGHWLLRLVISNSSQGYDLFRVLGSASCDITHQTRGTICYGHWNLRLVTSHTRQGYDLLGAFGSASCDNTQRENWYDL